MQTLLPFEPPAPVLPDVTDWWLLAEHKPPMCGWWWTAPLTAEGKVGELGQGMRFWLGHTFSLPYLSSVDRELAMERAVTPMSALPPWGMAWCGRVERATPYPYELGPQRWLEDMGSPVPARVRVETLWAETMPQPAFVTAVPPRIRVKVQR